MFRSQDDNPDSFKVRLRDEKFQLEQSTDQYVDYAAEQRAIDELCRPTRTYRSFAIIPDIVSIEILVKYGIDIHAPEFMHQKDLVRKVKNIIQTDYPLLLTSNIKKVG